MMDDPTVPSQKTASIRKMLVGWHDGHGSTIASDAFTVLSAVREYSIAMV
jgi:hypothetical protein